MHIHTCIVEYCLAYNVFAFALPCCVSSLDCLPVFYNCSLPALTIACLWIILLPLSWIILFTACPDYCLFWIFLLSHPAYCWLLCVLTLPVLTTLLKRSLQMDPQLSCHASNITIGTFQSCTIELHIENHYIYL